MKKAIAIVLCVALALPLGACALIGKLFEDGGTTGLPNPIVEQESAAAFSGIGLTLDAPEGATDVSYFIIDDAIAQVTFAWEGFAYTYRAGKGEGDISGVYDTFTDAFIVDYEADGTAFTAAAKNASTGGRLVTWSVNGVAYTLWCALAPGDDALTACVTGVMEKSFSSVKAPAFTEPETLSAVDFTEAQTLEMDLDGDGALERVSFEPVMSADGYTDAMVLQVASDSGREASATLPIMGPSSAFAIDIDADGFTELFISGDVASDDYETWLLRYDDGALIAAEPASEIDYEADYLLPAVYGSVTNIENGVVTVSDVVNLLGSWGCTTQYRMAAAGFALERVPGSVWTHADADSLGSDAFEWAAVTGAEFPVKLDGASGEATLPVGTHLVPLDTDGETYLHFITEDGTQGTVEVERNADGWSFSIGGVSEYDLFSQLPYAG